MAKIMAIGAHPDDIEIGCGATLYQLLQAGHEVFCVDLTDGEPTPCGSVEIRAEETEAANKVIGITNRVCLQLPNRTLMDCEEARRRLALEMRRCRPELVLTHIEKDAHPDHLAAAAITRGAVLLSRIVKIDLAYEPFRPRKVFSYLCSHLRYPYQPNFVVKVTEEDFTAKLTAVLQYKSQFVANENNLFVKDMLENRMKYFGYLIRCQYGEGFICEEPVKINSILDIL